ncbi:hypothetical protein ACHMW5_16765 [Azospirillum melinis]|uniref:hypothetical protein n=1 Tax=Azospirillum TaxID=191 RepID=UPI0011B3E81D|nr:hypothetical protein [Azospirillum sp. TSA6c]
MPAARLDTQLGPTAVAEHPHPGNRPVLPSTLFTVSAYLPSGPMAQVVVASHNLMERSIPDDIRDFLK